MINYLFFDNLVVLNHACNSSETKIINRIELNILINCRKKKSRFWKQELKFKKAKDAKEERQKVSAGEVCIKLNRTIVGKESYNFAVSDPDFP